MRAINRAFAIFQTFSLPTTLKNNNNWYLFFRICSKNHLFFELSLVLLHITFLPVNTKVLHQLWCCLIFFSQFLLSNFLCVCNSLVWSLFLIKNCCFVPEYIFLFFSYCYTHCPILFFPWVEWKISKTLMKNSLPVFIVWNCKLFWTHIVIFVTYLWWRIQSAFKEDSHETSIIHTILDLKFVTSSLFRTFSPTGDNFKLKKTLQALLSFQFPSENSCQSIQFVNLRTLIWATCVRETKRKEKFQWILNILSFQR